MPALNDAYSQCVSLHPERSAACQFDDEETTLSANSGSYPPGFYALMRLFATKNAEASVLAMRMMVWTLSALMWVGVLALAPSKSRYRVAMAAVVAAVPLGLFFAASTNPSAALIVGIPTAALAVLFAPYYRSRKGIAALALGAVAALMAVLSRSDAPFLLCVATTAVVVARAGARDWRRWWPIPAGVLAVAILGLAFAGSQSQALATGLSPDVASNPPGLLSVLQQLPIYFVGEYATTLGYMDVPMPPIVWASIAAALLGTVLLGLSSWSRYKGAGLAVLVGGQLAGIVYLQTHTGCCTLQPRYFLPLTIAWMALSAWVPYGVRRWRVNWAQGGLLALLLAGAHSIALRQVLERYSTGLNGIHNDLWLSDPLWWWNIPVPPAAVWLVGTTAFTIIIVWLVGRVASDASVLGPDRVSVSALSTDHGLPSLGEDDQVERG